MTNSSFRHESLQDAKSIKALLQAITDGMASGKLDLSDSDGSVTLEPSGLMRLKVTAKQEDGRHKLDVRISWQGSEDMTKDKSLKAKAL